MRVATLWICAREQSPNLNPSFICARRIQLTVTSRYDLHRLGAIRGVTLVLAVVLAGCAFPTAPSSPPTPPPFQCVEEPLLLDVWWRQGYAQGVLQVTQDGNLVMVEARRGLAPGRGSPITGEAATFGTMNLDEARCALDAEPFLVEPNWAYNVMYALSMAIPSDDLAALHDILMAMNWTDGRLAGCPRVEFRGKFSVFLQDGTHFMELGCLAGLRPPVAGMQTMRDALGRWLVRMAPQHGLLATFLDFPEEVTAQACSSLAVDGWALEARRSSTGGWGSVSTTTMRAVLAVDGTWTVVAGRWQSFAGEETHADPLPSAYPGNLHGLTLEEACGFLRGHGPRDAPTPNRIHHAYRFTLDQGEQESLHRLLDDRFFAVPPTSESGWCTDAGSSVFHVQVAERNHTVSARCVSSPEFQLFEADFEAWMQASLHARGLDAVDDQPWRANDIAKIPMVSHEGSCARSPVAMMALAQSGSWSEYPGRRDYLGITAAGDALHISFKANQRYWNGEPATLVWANEDRFVGLTPSEVCEFLAAFGENVDGLALQIEWAARSPALTNVPLDMVSKIESVQHLPASVFHPECGSNHGQNVTVWSGQSSHTVRFSPCVYEWPKEERKAYETLSSLLAAMRDYEGALRFEYGAG